MDERRKILLVEDDPLDRETFLRFVREQNLPYDFLAAASVAEAKDLLACEHFDIIVCDYFLGDGTALDVLNEIKHIPVVIITGVKDEDVAIRAWKAGAYDYITKSRRPTYLNAVPKTIENVIQRKTLETILIAKRKSLEAIFDAVPVGMLLVDENAKVLRVNDTIRQIVGQEYSQIINRDLSDVLGCSDESCRAEKGQFSPPCPACSLRDILERVLKLHQSVDEVEIQVNLQKPDREIRPWLSISARPATIDEKRHVVMAVVDITDRRRMEQKLKETMDLKSQFVSTVSHELRTPLTTIKEGLGLVLDGVAGGINQEQKKFLEMAKRNVDRLSDLINDVLDFQRLETGRAKLEVSYNDVQSIINEVCETMSLHADKSQVHLECDTCQELPTAPCDRTQIIQVLTNLIGNAIKFTPAGGRVSVRARQQDTHVLIEICDTGIGIPKEALSRIFDRFYQVNRSIAKSQGTGLGLSIVNEIVHMHNGRIEVESAPDKGSTFTVFLPLETECSNKSISVSEDRTLEDIVTK